MKKLLLFAFITFCLKSNAQVQLASDINQGNFGSHIEFVFELNNEIYFSAIEGEFLSNSERKLWKTNGTENGTIQLADLPTSNIYKSDNAIYYATYNEIWKSDGTENGTTKIAQDITKLKPLGTFKGNFYYLAVYNIDQEIGLHKTDGTTTTIIKTFAPDTKATNLGNNENAVFNLDDTRCVLYIKTKTLGVEPYISDGTEAGTYFLKNLSPNANNSMPSSFHKMDDKFVFTNNLNQLWITDTTEEGTKFIGTFGNAQSKRAQPTVFNNKVYYGKNDEFWESDGTIEGNTMLFKNKDSDGEVEGIIHNGNNLVILLKRGIHVFDGTTTTKLAIPDITSTSNTSYIKSDSKIYFTANYKDQGDRLWTTDGTVAGTTSIEPFWPDGEVPFNFLRPIGNNLLFTLPTVTGNKYNMGELWFTDGTRANTKMIKDINKLGNGSSSPKFQTTLNGKIYFAADDNIHGNELFVFDGTTTSLIKDINPGIHSSNPNDFYVVNNKIYFKSYTLDKGHELWVTDGTAAGTTIVKDINPNKGNAFKYINTGVHNIIGEISLYNNELYFYANNGVNGYEPWKTDGTETGTKMIKDINSGSFSSTNYDLGNRPKFIPYKNELYFFASKSGPDYQLSKLEMWKTDGTAAGTKLATAGNTITKEGTFNIFSLFVFQDHLYFMGEGRYSRKNNFFKTDGTNAGTVIIEDFGYSGGTPIAYLLKDKIYYTKDSGKQFWTIDKDDNKTEITNTIDGYRSTSSNDFFIHNNYLYFAIRTQTYQTELWRLSDTTAPKKLFSKETESGTNSVENYFNYIVNGDNLFVNTQHNGNSDFMYRMYYVEDNATLTPVLSINNNDVRYENLAGGFKYYSTFLNNKLYFTGNFNDKGEELLVTDLSAVLSVDNFNEITSDNSFTLYPNPVTNVLNIKSKSTIKSGVIYNLLGKKITTISSDVVDVSKFNSGIYILKIEDELGNISSKKWIKN